MAPLYGWLVELLRAGRLAARGHRPQRMDTPAHAQMLLVALAPSARASEGVAAAGSQRPSLGNSLLKARRLGNGPARRAPAGIEDPHAQSSRVLSSMGNRGGTPCVTPCTVQPPDA